jgi:ATP-binding protein involved in chromosome partitioning
MSPESILSQVQHVIAVASGKGGVGKSTVSVNLALALAATGAKVGLMDADVYGPSMAMMLGLEHPPEVTQTQQIIPLKKHGLEVISMGVLSTPNSPIVWRGPMVSNLIQQFLSTVKWSVLDYLIIDLPPGTGDVQLTLTQNAPLSGAVIVTTPQDISLLDARKGLMMFDQVHVPVLGVVENMSTFVCGHCQKSTDIFGSGGGNKISQFFGVPFIGQIPLDPRIVQGGDTGTPLFLEHPDSEPAKAFRKIAQNMVTELEIINAAEYTLPKDFKLVWQKNA